VGSAHAVIRASEIVEHEIGAANDHRVGGVHFNNAHHCPV
jgi:hypothetical protein